MTDPAAEQIAIVPGTSAAMSWPGGTPGVRAAGRRGTRTVAGALCAVRRVAFLALVTVSSSERARRRWPG
ncbi:hypothetical protein ACFU5P_28105 [Streptomyces sp. NPDC057433]|uniref:hypothetical protein n=1 Tax=Streptomyces sp. NPDC057433 TaxID=3346132 RepID=UPI0036A7E163